MNIIRELSLPDFFSFMDGFAYYLVRQDGYYVLVGIYIDSSIDPDSFFVQYFIQPLFIPFPTFVFTIGERIGGHWSVNDVEKINAMLANIKTPKTFAEIKALLSTDFKRLDDLFKHEFLGYINFLLSNKEDALKELRTVAMARKYFQPGWNTEPIKRAEDFIDLINQDDQGTARSRLLQWQADTMELLKIKPYST